MTEMLAQGSLFDSWLEEEEPEPEFEPAPIPQPSPERALAVAAVVALREASPEPIWRGEERLRGYLRPIADVRALLVEPSRDDVDQLTEGLERFGQTQPVLESDSGEIIGRDYLVFAAARLGWSHVAVRLDIAERSAESHDQISLVDEVERSAVRNGDGLSSRDLAAIEAMAVRDPLAGLSEQEVSAINAASVDSDTDWVGLPEFLSVGEPLKVVVSCDSEDDRDALFSILGVRTIHKGTRGTLSVWWPDREREDLSSLRFVVKEEPEP